MALFGRKNANKNNDSPKGENKQDPAQKDERIAGNEPEPAEESAPPPSAPAPAAEPQPEEKPQEPQETQQPQPDRPAHELAALASRFHRDLPGGSVQPQFRRGLRGHRR